MIIRLPIDLKSLYLNIKNDNQTGHTPTVATPLKQGSSIHSEIARILQIKENMPPNSKEGLSLHILSKSRAEAKIVKAYIFDNITVNGLPVDISASYCIYIREETDPSNVHCGRQKVHYPQVLIYEDEDVCINNQEVIRSVSRTLHDYAFIVQAFEYNTANGVLNIDALIVGYNGIPYSKVFTNKRGVGDKFTSIFHEYADVYDTEIIAMRDKLGYDNVSPENFMEIMLQNKKYAIDHVVEHITENKGESINLLSQIYPYALFDIEVTRGQTKQYILVEFTSTKLHYFCLQSNRIRFVNDFPDHVQVCLVSDVNGIPTISWYSAKDLATFKKIVSSVTYECRS